MQGRATNDDGGDECEHADCLDRVVQEYGRVCGESTIQEPDAWDSRLFSPTDNSCGLGSDDLQNT